MNWDQPEFRSGSRSAAGQMSDSVGVGDNKLKLKKMCSF